MFKIHTSIKYFFINIHFYMQKPLYLYNESKFKSSPNSQFFLLINNTACNFIFYIQPYLKY